MIDATLKALPSSHSPSEIKVFTPLLSWGIVHNSDDEYIAKQALYSSLFKPSRWTSPILIDGSPVIESLSLYKKIQVKIIFRKRKFLCEALPAAPTSVQPCRAWFAQGWWVCRVAGALGGEGRDKMGTSEGVGCREWGEDEKRHCREQEGAEWAGKGQFRCPPSCRAEARKGGHNKNMVRWQLWSAFETSLTQDTTFPAALQGWELLCYHRGRAKGCTLLLGANIGILTLFLGIKQGKLAKLLQYHSALVLDFDPTDKGSACKHLTKKTKASIKRKNNQAQNMKTYQNISSDTTLENILQTQAHSTFLEHSLILPPPHRTVPEM